MALGQHRAALLFLGLVALPALASATPERSALTPEAEPGGGSLGKHGLWFEPNVGQADPSVQFLGRAEGFDVLLTSEEIVLSFREPAVPLDSAESRPGERFKRWRDAQPVRVRMRFKGGDLANRAVAVEPLEGVSHYLVGAERERWRIGIPHYARVECRDVYPGVNLVLRGNGRRLVYDLVVAPHADPGRIELEFDGGEQVSQGPDGEVLVHTARGRIRHSTPFAYQERDGDRRQVPAKLTRKGRSGATYTIAGYDHSRSLVIDPEISYVTTLGGTGSDVAFGVTGDGLGNAYLAGFTSSAGYPTTPGSYESQRDRSGYLGFVTKLSPEGAVLFSTYLGGSVSDGAFEVTLDPGGRIAVAGSTSSADFPIVNGFQGTYLGGDGQSGFVAVLSANGAALVYSSFLGGTGEGGFGDDVVEAIAADAAGQVYLGGLTNSADFPTKGAAQPALGGFYDAFVMKIDVDLLGPDSLLYSTYLGGANADEALAMAVDSAGTIHVGGQTGSLDFPTVRPLQDRSGGGTDAFVARIDPALAPSQQILYSTYIGGEARDRVFGLALDPQGPVYAVGATLSTRFPVTPGGRPDPDYVPSPLRNFSDGFFIKLDPRFGESEGLLYSTYLGGQRADEAAAVAVDNGGNIYIGGTSASPDFPTGRGSTLPGPFVLAWRSSLEPLWEWAQPNQTAYQQVRGMAVTGDGAVYLVGESSPTLQFGGEDVLAIRLAPPQQGRLQILAITDRWKAQRADDPVNVVVGSSSELDTGRPFTLRYTGKKPDGSVVAATTEITLSATPVGPPPQGYTYGYSLSWNHVDGAGAKLPAANYTLVVKAPVLSSQLPAPLPLESPEYTKVSLVEVVTIAVEDASGLALQDNPPSHGGGKRIFAEAAQAGGTVTDKLKVAATIFPPVPDAPAGQGVSVHFRSFDADDPSASTAPVDDESQPTDNCLGATAGPPQNCPVADAGLLYDPATDPNAANPVNGTTGLQLAASGDQAIAGLRVAMLAGANYRVVASTSSQWLGTLSAPGNRTDGAVLEGTTALPEGQQSTHMVTVWRTLHLQFARMTLPSYTQSTLEHLATATCPTAPCIQGDQLEDTNGIPHPDHGTVTNTWMGADLDVSPATPQGAPRSDKHIVTNSTATSLAALTPLTPHDPNFDYALWDDEVDSLSIWAQLDDSLARTILRDAYIEVDTIVGVNPFFDRNLEDTEVAALPMATASSLGYWTAPIVLAFEGDAEKNDGDPSTEKYIHGLANGPEAGGTSRQPRVAIYAETIRDYRATPLANAPANRVPRDEIMANVTAHEILHLFGLIHDGNRSDGGMMCASLYVDGSEVNRRRVTPHQLKLVREATEIKIRRSQVNCR